MEWLLIGGALLLVLRGAGANLSGILPSGTIPRGGAMPMTGGADPGSAPVRHVNDNAPGAGSVTIGGKPSDAGWNPHAGIADNIAKYAGMGAGLAGAAGIGSAGGIIGGSTFGAAGTMVGTAVPIIGIGAMVVMTVLGIIHAHHAAALAREGKVLNETDPAMLNAMVMVAQATIAGEINSVSEARSHTDQIVADWYGQVKSIQRGTWHYTGQDMTADYDKVWKKRTQPAKGAPGFSDYHAPDPCNGACVIGHFFVERTAFVVLDTVKKILAGQHGVMIFPQLPPHETQQGFPEIRMQY